MLSAPEQVGMEIDIYRSENRIAGANIIIIILTDKNFTLNVLDNTRHIMVMFASGWSGPSHMMKPIIKDLAARFSDKVVFGKLDVDNNPKTAARFAIAILPTLLFFKNGNVVDRINGVISKTELTDKLERLLR
jgi:thioredoxin 1